MSFLRASYRIELTLIDAAVVPFDLFQVTGDVRNKCWMSQETPKMGCRSWKACKNQPVDVCECHTLGRLAIQHVQFSELISATIRSRRKQLDRSSQTSLQKSLIIRKQSTGLALAHQVFGFAVGTAARLSERVPGTRLVQEQHPLVTTHGRPARCDARHWLRIAAMRTLIARRFATK